MCGDLRPLSPPRSETKALPWASILPLPPLEVRGGVGGGRRGEARGDSYLGSTEAVPRRCLETSRERGGAAQAEPRVGGRGAVTPRPGLAHRPLGAAFRGLACLQRGP